MLRLITLNVFVELVCFVVSVVCLNKDRSWPWHGMSLFLLLTCITEMLGVHFKLLYLADRAHARPNIWLYNGLLIFQALFITYVFERFINRYVRIRPVMIIGLLILATSYGYELYNHGIFIYNEITNTLMLITFVLYSLYYYYLLLKDENYINLNRSPEFWWVAGILFFYFGSTATNVFFDYLYPYHSPDVRYLSKTIFRGLNILLYGCWCYSFICKKWALQISEA
ncbi:hypothetical protein MUY27_12060 [Mucilaginibacter sp. RS28]|uniref:Uncharacterized protein n=1 Tax=Mucilaginibacter straminoryzae TaxID=2932774 RepID=A0A9X1X3D6_9SPHI|nr:hypothetical protein [Mucilaginibacter straminoryzae]MCJ8210442.1 hypothetical protein [Mucilaginibacter straminoryzae]